MTRKASIARKTKETQIELELNLDGDGVSQISTGVGFLDHMLDLFAKHGKFDLKVEAQGDLHIDQHHTVEDIGICLGQVFGEALGNKQGIRRYGFFVLPMEETLVDTAVDLSGRAFWVFNVNFPTEKIGDFDTELVYDFWQSASSNLPCNLHVNLRYGRNSHHISEAVFKGLARAFRMAIEQDHRETGIPSTKGVL